MRRREGGTILPPASVTVKGSGPAKFTRDLEELDGAQQLLPAGPARQRTFVNELASRARPRRSAALVALLALFAILGVGIARAQQSAGLRVDVTSVTTADYPNARAVVNVEDSSGGDVQQLTAANFSATLDGAPVTIASAELASSQKLPLDLLLVMDVSGSMAGSPIQQAKEAARAFVNSLAPEDRVAVLAFSDDVRLVQDYTTDRAQTITAIDGLQAAGNTALYKATQAAAYSMATSAASRRVAILLSDGAQDGVPLTATRDEALASAASAGAPFFTIGEGRGIDRDYLSALATQTKGRYLEAPNPDDLTGLYAGIGKLLRSQYVVTFNAAAARERSSLTLQVRAGELSASGSATFSPATGFAPAAPVVSGLKDGEVIDGKRKVTVDGGNRADARVTFYLDDTNVTELTKPPFTYTLDPAALASGAHSLRVVVTDAAGAQPAQAAIGFNWTAPPPPRAGGLPLLPIAAALAGVIVVALVGAVVLRIRAVREQAPQTADGVLALAKPSLSAPPPSADESPAEPESIGEPMGLLVARNGSDIGSEYAVGGSPVSIGSGWRCGVRIEDPELGAEEARIWIRKGHLMVHRITRLTTMVNTGATGGWAILDPGDTFDIGSHRYEFRLLPVEQPEPRPEPAPGDIPNVLRDPDVPRRPAAIEAPPPSGPRSANTSPLAELMPRDDWGKNTD